MKKYLTSTSIYRWYKRKKTPHLFDKRFSYGEGTYGVKKLNVFLWKKTDRIKIGKYCCIGPNVTILASGEHYTNRVSVFPFKANILKLGDEEDTRSKGPVIIGNDVWIGHGVTILSGVNIGDGAIIGAGSLVISDVESYSIVAGVPAKKVMDRFSKGVRIKLKKIAWWDWGREKIENNISDFYLDVDNFTNKHITP